MADTTATRIDSYKPSAGPFQRFRVQEDAILVYGGLVSVAADGYLKNAADAAGEKFVGVAVETVTGGAAAGDVYCLVDVGGALVKVVHEDGSMTVADIGDSVMAEFNDEVTSAATGTNDIPVGTIIDFESATVIWVQCRPFNVIS